MRSGTATALHGAETAMGRRTSGNARLGLQPGHEFVGPVAAGSGGFADIEGVVTALRINLEVFDYVQSLQLLLDLARERDRRGGVVFGVAHEDGRGRADECEGRGRA